MSFRVSAPPHPFDPYRGFVVESRKMLGQPFQAAFDMIGQIQPKLIVAIADVFLGHGRLFFGDGACVSEFLAALNGLLQFVFKVHFN